MSRLPRAVAVPERGFVKVAKPEAATRARLGANGRAEDWLCAWCLNHVASEKDRFRFNGQSEFSFTNPAGIVFHIVTFSRSPGCSQVGEPTLEHTWFCGHAWSYCICNRCRMHLGWAYSGPGSFVGLIGDRLVRAAVAFN